MKLLLDENLSPRLVQALADLYPESMHVRDCGLERADDIKIWDYAKGNGFTIVSKDSDFVDRSLLNGFPPKVIRIRLGNCSTRAIGALLRELSPVIHTFEQDPHECLLFLP